MSHGQDLWTGTEDNGEDTPRCACGHKRQAHAMSYPKHKGRYCKLCPCTGFTPKRIET